MHVPQHLPRRFSCGRLTGPIGSIRPSLMRRDRKLRHLRNGVAMNAKPLCGLPAAEPIHHHRASYPGIEFHCEHPSSLPCHSKASRRPNRTGTLLRRRRKAIKARSVVHFITAVYICHRHRQNVPDGGLKVYQSSYEKRVA